MKHPTLKLFSIYMLTLLLILLFSGSVFGQSIKVLSINASWNKENKVEWINELDSCDIHHIKLCKKPRTAKKYRIVVIPTIILLVDGKEIKRFEADLSFKMVATKEEVQKYIDKLLITDDY